LGKVRARSAESGRDRLRAELYCNGVKGSTSDRLPSRRTVELLDIPRLKNEALGLERSVAKGTGAGTIDPADTMTVADAAFGVEPRPAGGRSTSG